MKKILAIAVLAAGAAITSLSPAIAAQGCGPGFHRGPYGACKPNRGPVVRGPVVVVPGGPRVGTFYAGRGYWDGRRYYQNRYRYNGGWRYR